MKCRNMKKIFSHLILLDYKIEVRELLQNRKLGKEWDLPILFIYLIHTSGKFIKKNDKHMN